LINFALQLSPSLRASAKRASEAIQCGVCVDVHAPHWIASLARFALARNDGVFVSRKVLQYQIK